MYSLAALCLFHFSFGVNLVSGGTHWVLSKNGSKIHTMVDSPYHISQSHSLVQLMEQDNKVNAIASSHTFFSEQEKAIIGNEISDDPDLEKKIRSEDPDCQLGSGISSDRNSFMKSYLSNMIAEDLQYFRSINLNMEHSSDDEPHCTSNLPFSMYAFEHLPSMQSRHSLKFDPEVIHDQLLQPFKSLTQFSSVVAKSIQEDHENAYFLRLAALYWRIKGHAPNTIECLRMALYFNEKKFHARTMLDLGNAVHRAGYFADAVILYQSVLPKLYDSIANIALGDAYALLENRTEAIEQYEIAVKKGAMWQALPNKIAALKCDLKIINAMTKQHNLLLSTIEKKNEYNNEVELIKNYEEDVRKTMVDANVRLQSSLIYDYFTYGILPYSNCHSSMVSNRLTMHCTVSDWRRYQATRNERHRKFVESAKRKAPKCKDDCDAPFTKEMVEYDEDEVEKNNIFMQRLQQLKQSFKNEKTIQPSHAIEPSAAVSEMLEQYLGNDWPNITSCEIDRWQYPFPTMQTLPMIFLAPEKRGFSTFDLLTKMIGLSIDEEHPFPWHQPHCHSYVQTQVPSVFMLRGVRSVLSRRYPSELPEEKLRQIFLNLVNGRVAEADIAQRIRTLIENEIGPRWVLFNLAALYWRSVGAPKQAIACLQAAVQSEINRSHADVAFVQLAQIVVRYSESLDHIEDSITILNYAVQLNPKEPITHFLIGVGRVLQNKMTEAMAPIRQAVTLDPNYESAVSLLRALKCLKKLINKRLAKAVDPRCCSSAEQDVYCVGPNDQHCYVSDNENVRVAKDCDGFILTNTCKSVSSSTIFFIIIALGKKQKDQIKSKSSNAEISRIIKGFEQSGMKADINREIPLDYGAEDCFKTMIKLTEKRKRNIARTEMIFTKGGSLPMNEEEIWVEEIGNSAAENSITLQTPSSNQVNDRREMLTLDIPIPRKLPVPTFEQINSGLKYLPLPTELEAVTKFCSSSKNGLTIIREQTSTWLSITAKGVNLNNYINLKDPIVRMDDFEPVCPSFYGPSSLALLDNLFFEHQNDKFIFYKPEKALTDAFLSLGNEKEQIEVVASRLMNAMADKKSNEIHWSLSTAAALYWRVKGDHENALKCLRLSLNNAPAQMTDVVLLSMANIYHQAGLLHSALVVGGAALSVSPKLVVIHFTLANIYASLNDYKNAMKFYFSTLSLQANFEPAKERIRAIYCLIKLQKKSHNF